MNNTNPRRMISTYMEGLSIIVVLSCLFSTFMISIGVSTITTTQFLTDGATIVSSGQTFKLGFFSPVNSANRYVGIWYNKISTPTPTVVWVANRDIPLIDKWGVLKLTNQGILTLLNRTNSTIWSSNSSTPLTLSPVAELLESGNLVVKDADDDNPDNYVWQSFDHPCDTLMPEMKLGMNLGTGLDRYLSSWKSPNDPSNGDFTFRLDLRGSPQLVLMKGSVEQYRSGPWMGSTFSGSQGLKPNPIFAYGLVYNQYEVYYSFQLKNTSVYSRLSLNSNGIVQRLTWNNRTQDWNVYLRVPVDNCDVYGLCRGFGSCNIGKSPVCGCLDKFVPIYPKDWGNANWSNGCVRRTPLDCENGDGFIKYSGKKLPDTRYSSYSGSITLDECKNECLKNCPCMAYANSDTRGGGSGCFHWFGELIDVRDLTENGQDLYIRVASSELNSTSPMLGFNDKKEEKIKVILPLIAGMLVLGLSLTWYVWKRKIKKQQQQQKQQEEQLKREGRIGQRSEQCYTSESQKDDLELPLFDLATITAATDNFSVNNKLGEGGFGPVYKGMLEKEQEIAVKRLSQYSAQGLDQFKNEVICIAKLQHRNLVKLLGCCIQGEEKMLIYEYMPNKSLDSFIFDQTRRTLLDWPKRLNIINGIARGILYLHQDSRLRIIHRDLKAANILLDTDMNPKISDFGIARSFGGNETEANTQRVVGTYGYMSPEYAVDGLFSVKSDVFSFGVLVLEIVSGKKNRGFFHPDHHHNLLGHAWNLYKEGKSLELIDEHVGNSCNLSEVLRSIHVGLLCVQQCPEDRPSMSSVVLMLGGKDALPQPKEPGFFAKRNILFEVDYSSNSNFSK